MGSWYGNFDILFTGASINCDEAFKVDSLQKYICGDSQTYQADLSDAESEAELRKRLWFNTTYIHESRHVHDYFLCPILNYGYRLRLMMVYNTMCAILHEERLNKEHYNVLPIPLQDWFHATPSEQKDYLSSWSNIGFRAKAPLVSVPEDALLRAHIGHYGEDEYSRLLLNGAASYESYSKIHRHTLGDQYGRAIHLNNMMEASAVTTQLTDAFLLYGKEYENLMLDDIVNASRLEVGERRVFSDYSVILSYINAYIKRTRVIELEHLIPYTSVLMNWCFSGNLMDPNAMADPTMRFYYFLHNNLGEGVTIDHLIDDPLSVFAYWDKKLDSEPINYSEFFSDNLQQYITLVELSKNQSFDWLTYYAQMVAVATHRISKSFLANPTYYIFPDGYSISYNHYINVPLRFHVKSDALDTSIINRSKSTIILDNQQKSRSSNSVKSCTIDSPMVNVVRDALPVCAKEETLHSKFCDDFIPFANIAESLYDTNNPKLSTSDINSIVSPLQVRYLL